MVISVGRGAGPDDTNATHGLFLEQIQIGFTFLLPAHPGSPGQRVLLLLLFSNTSQVLNTRRVWFACM